jgi:hypothetical protein
LRIAAVYSHKGGAELMETAYPHELAQIVTVINSIEAETCRTKQSEEVTMMGAMLYSPTDLNLALKSGFKNVGWSSKRITLSSPAISGVDNHSGFREIDFVKNGVGIEVQFGKYAFLPYDVVVKMIIFGRLKLINIGVEILPVKSMVAHMSSGIGHFQQLATDLYHRGVADIDLPVMVIGVAPDEDVVSPSVSVEQEVI